MSEIEVKTGSGLAQAEPNVVDLLKHASASGCTPEVMERLVALYERSQAIKAREAFYAAMSEFKATCPPVKRCTPNSQFMVKRDGREVPRMYASLEDIASTVRGPLDACGLSYRWGDTTFDNGKIRVACIVTHRAGHSESASVLMDTNASGGASPQQKSAIVETYAMRYSLIKALGLTTCDEDDDGNGPNGTPGEKIDQYQALDIETLIKERGADRAKFLAWAKVTNVLDIAKADYAKVIDAIKRSGKK